MAKLPGGRGPRWGTPVDAYTNQSDSWDQRREAIPLADQLFISPAGTSLGISQQSVAYSAVTRIFYIPRLVSPISVLRARFRVVSYAAPFTLSIALYEFLAQENTLRKLTDTAVDIAVSANGAYSQNLATAVRLLPTSQYFLGMYSAATAPILACASAAVASAINVGRVAPTVGLPDNVPINTTTGTAAPIPAIYYLSQTGIDLFA